ncbi:MAG: hypothetical protein ACM3SQ_01315 [Betaproteobacteria bacterium]
MADEFVVHLGGGLYLDAGGNITSGPQTPRTQVYSAPDGIKLDTGKISSTLKDIADALEKDATKKAITDIANKLGLSAGLLKFALDAAAAGATIASFASVAGAVLGIALSVLGALASDDGISPQLAAVLQAIRDEIKAVDDHLTADTMIDIRSKLDAPIHSIAGALQDVIVQNLRGKARAQALSAIETDVKSALQPLLVLFNQDWSPLFYEDQYKEVFGHLATVLCTQDAAGNLVPLTNQPNTVRRFDYRLGVAMLTFASTVYPALVAAGRPWFRSAGSHAHDLRSFADAIDALVARMYTDSFARTVYTGNSLFAHEGEIPFFVPYSFGGGAQVEVDRRPWSNEYLVGAADLARYTDAWFWDTLGNQLADPGYDTGHRGALDYRWPRGVPLPADYDARAQLANEQAERDLADLQAASGMVHLVAAGARMRFLSTPPVQSETVRNGQTVATQAFDSEEPATATSPWIFPTGVIESPATLKRFHAGARASVDTQEPGYSFAFNYRVRLVAVRSQIGREGWRNAGYVDNVWHPWYVPATGDPRNQRLQVDIYPGALHDSGVGLYTPNGANGGPSPAEPYDNSGTVTMSASTFDWYVPTRTFVFPLGTGAGLAASAARRAGGVLGGAGGGGTSVHAMSPVEVRAVGGAAAVGAGGGGGSGGGAGAGGAQVSTVVDGISRVIGHGALAGLDHFDASLDHAERRHVREEPVTFDWSLHWEDGHLQVQVTGRPENRPFQLWLVIEEDVYSGETLPNDLGDVMAMPNLRTEIHTAIPLEVVNGTLLVPDTFFKEEAAALAKGRKLWNDLNREYAKSRQPGPGEPSMLGVAEQLQRTLGDSMSTAAIAERLNRRLGFMQAHAPSLFMRVWQAEGVEERNVDAARALEAYLGDVR